MQGTQYGSLGSACDVVTSRLCNRRCIDADTYLRQHGRCHATDPVIKGAYPIVYFAKALKGQGGDRYSKNPQNNEFPQG